MRGSGRTTRQMQDASEGAWFVVRDGGMLSYVYQLQKELGREDLEVILPSRIRPDTLMGFLGEIVVDHAAYISGEQYHALMCWMQQKIMRNGK